MPKFVNIEDLRRAAKWNMPKPMFDFVDGGANAEWTPARESRRRSSGSLFDPRVLGRCFGAGQSTTVFGEKVKTPIIVAPTGTDQHRVAERARSWPPGRPARAGAGLALSTYAPRTRSRRSPRPGPARSGSSCTSAATAR